MKDVFISCKTINIKDQTEKEFNEKDCLFGYRTSRFKSIDKNIYIITSIKIRLTKEKHKYNITYGSLKEVIGNREVNLESISKAVIKIRKSKLPDTNIIGNCGSFFKNPIITGAAREKLLKKHSQFSIQEQEDGEHFKVSAAQLIDAAGLKGLSVGGAAVWKRQPLVLINTGGASASEFLSLAKLISRKVQKVYGIPLELEPIVL